MAKIIPTHETLLWSHRFIYLYAASTERTWRLCHVVRFVCFSYKEIILANIKFDQISCNLDVIKSTRFRGTRSTRSCSFLPNWTMTQAFSWIGKYKWRFAGRHLQKYFFGDIQEKPSISITQGKQKIVGNNVTIILLIANSTNVGFSTKGNKFQFEKSLRYIFFGSPVRFLLPVSIRIPQDTQPQKRTFTRSPLCSCFYTINEMTCWLFESCHTAFWLWWGLGIESYLLKICCWPYAFHKSLEACGAAICEPDLALFPSPARKSWPRR